MSQLLQQAQQMQEQLMAAQQDLTESEVTGTSGGGLVRATMTGGGELTAMQIDPSVVDPQDVETLSDLVVAAVRDAQAEVQRLASEQLGSVGGGVEGLLGGAGGLQDLFGGSPEVVESSAEPDDESGEHGSSPGQQG
ncbi:YbaB/EbfC family nucleoid-associated protein [Actinobacteria bacterium YIM 96077]|uniref:Nucleoid-associated protein DPM12_02495 n=1 Tax=Phytoactinopolyspora halophila TaxID=1981511 RepID=A0A329R0L2_9ACTN|nr:YbaB/EbfC family nucleoid-associated protein [Phytoactinopolyspora halophila]AYY15193.1 YbaB/EbfC family nucleoid-associated protein [Actinobacteria bacterium YIM 96077]RAW18135.1 YbaB/EbfC family nucleoid-associated protein [Phytoactinopolyspora halophila]